MRCDALLKTNKWPYVYRCHGEVVDESLYYVEGPNEWMALCPDHLKEGAEMGVINITETRGWELSEAD